MENQPAFKQIADSFRLNVQTLRVFNEQIAPIADAHDQSARREWSDSLRQAIPQLEQFKGSEIRLTSSSNEDAEEGEDAEQEQKRVLVDRETLLHIIEAGEQMNIRAPAQGPLLRRGALITLMSYFEVLISDLIQLYYSMYPAKLSKDKKLDLDTLRILNPTGVVDIEKHLAAKEANDALYRNSEDQLDYFVDTLRVNLTPLDSERKRLTEISQRRNLIVHNRSIVNRQYLSRVDDDLIGEFNVEEGKTLSVTEKYLNAAIDTVYVVGVSLTQFCWRRWDASSIELADHEVVTEILYKSLLAERYGVTVRTAEKLQNIEYSKEMYKRMAIINHAIALRDLGRATEMEDVLVSTDWSACSHDFRLALHALREKEEDFYQLLPTALSSENITKKDLEVWPVFRPQRQTKRFSEMMKKQFDSGTSGRGSE